MAKTKTPEESHLQEQAIMLSRMAEEEGFEKVLNLSPEMKETIINECLNQEQFKPLIDGILKEEPERVTEASQYGDAYALAYQQMAGEEALIQFLNENKDADDLVIDYFSIAGQFNAVLPQLSDVDKLVGYEIAEIEGVARVADKAKSALPAFLNNVIIDASDSSNNRYDSEELKVIDALYQNCLVIDLIAEDLTNSMKEAEEETEKLENQFFAKLDDLTKNESLTEALYDNIGIAISETIQEYFQEKGFEVKVTELDNQVAQTMRSNDKDYECEFIDIETLCKSLKDQQRAKTEE